MATQSQIAANRKNAQKSTGPRTPEGKAKSAQNATTHGLTAQSDVIKGESREDYDAHKQSFLDVLNPQNAVEDFLADRVASLAWRLKRAARMQNQFQDAFIADREYHHKWRHGDYYLPSEQDPGLILGCFARKDYAGQKVLERLVLYERRIENSFFKCLNTLEKQKRQNPLGANLPSPTAAAPSHMPPTHPQIPNAQNEPNSTEPSIATSWNGNAYDTSPRTVGASGKGKDGPSFAPREAPRVTCGTITRRY